MINRRQAAIGLLAIDAAAWPFFVRGQAAGKTPRIGYLGFRSRPSELEAAFLAGLREQGYIEGQNITIEWRFAGGKAENLAPLAAELVALRVDLIVAASFQSITAAAAATKTIPIVFPANADPVGSGFVASMSRPGGNITGLSTLAGDLGAKQIELLKSALPRLSKLAVLLNPANGGNAFVVKSLEAGARNAGVTLLPFDVTTLEGIERAFVAMTAARADAVTLAIDGFFVQEGGRIAALALRHKLAFISPVQADVGAGALMSYGSKLSDNYRRTALYVDKILKGAKPGELPVEQPTAVELLINLKTAKALGLTIPQSLLLRADEVVN